MESRKTNNENNGKIDGKLSMEWTINSQKALCENARKRRTIEKVIEKRTIGKKVFYNFQLPVQLLSPTYFHYLIYHIYDYSVLFPLYRW